MSRWKHKSESVTLGEDVVTVRGLTAGERTEFLHANKEAQREDAPSDAKMKVMARAVQMGTGLSAEDVATMPVELFDLVWAKIIAMTGMDKSEKKAEPATLNS